MTDLHGVTILRNVLAALLQISNHSAEVARPDCRLRSLNRGHKVDTSYKVTKIYLGIYIANIQP
jgi:hypothetical protein